MTETEQIDPGAALAAACASAEVAFQRGDIHRARAAADEALAHARAGGDRPCEARALQLLSEIDYDELVYPRAVEALDTAIAIRRELFGDAHLLTRYSLACRAVVLVGLHRPEDADADIAAAAAAGAAPSTPAEAAQHARFWVALGSAYHTRDKDPEARRIFEALLGAADHGESVEPISLANAHLHYASVLEQAGASERALALNRTTIEMRRRLIGEPSLRVALALVGLGTSQLRLGRVDEARATLMDSAAMLRAAGHEQHPRSSVVFLGIAVTEIMAGHGPASERWMARAIDLETRTFGGVHPNSATMLMAAAKMFAVRGHHGRAAELAQRAAAALLPFARTRAEGFTEAAGQVFLSLRHLKRHDAILRWLEPQIEALERIDPPPYRALAPLLNMIGESYMSAGKLSRAEAVLRRSIQLTEREHGMESEQMHALYTNLAVLLRRQKRIIEAEDADRRAKRIEEAREERKFTSFGRRRVRGLA